MAKPDVTIYGETGHDTVYVFTARTLRALRWIEENVSSESWQWMGNGLAVDHRYAGNLAEAMQDDGLVVK